MIRDLPPTPYNPHCLKIPWETFSVNQIMPWLRPSKVGECNGQFCVNQTRRLRSSARCTRNGNHLRLPIGGKTLFIRQHVIGEKGASSPNADSVEMPHHPLWDGP